MEKYQEFYKYSERVFDEERLRFVRVEDKAKGFITFISALLAVFVLTGRQ